MKNSSCQSFTKSKKMDIGVREAGDKWILRVRVVGIR